MSIGADNTNTNHNKLSNYLARIFLFGTPEETLALSSISSAPPLMIKQKLIIHELVGHACQADYEGQQNLQHSIMQRYLMKNDTRIIATEIPVWTDALRGHIDGIRLLENDLIEVHDFKPKAKNEKKASSQLYRYCVALSERTSIPMISMRAVYYDNKHAYQVSLL